MLSKKFILLLFILGLLGASTIGTYANITGNQDNPLSLPFVLNNQTANPPQVAAYPFILCEMKGSLLAFDVPDDIAYLSYDISRGDEILQRGSVSVVNPVITIVLAPGT